MSNQALKGGAIKLFTACILFLGLLLPVIHHRATAQENAAKLESSYEHIKDTTDIRKAVQYADKLYKTNFYAARKLTLYALKKSKELNYHMGMLHAYNLLGVMEQHKGNYEGSLPLFQQALVYASEPKGYNMAPFVINNIGGVYAATGKYDLSLEYFQKTLASLKKATKANKSYDSLIAYNNIATLWNLMEEREEGMRMLKMAQVIANRTKDTMYGAIIANNIGVVNLNLGYLDSAIVNFNDGLKLAQAAGLKNQIFMALYDLGTIYHIKKDYPTALAYCRLAMTDTTGIDVSLMLEGKMVLGDAYTGMKQYDKAKQILTEALHAAEQSNKEYLVQNIKMKLAEAMAGAGDYKTAYGYAEKYLIAKDSLLKHKKNNFLDAWIRSRTAEKDKTVLQQKLAFAKQTAALQKRNFWISIFALSALLLLVITVAFIIFYRQRNEKQSAEITRLRQQQEINQLKAQMRGEEQERQRIARDLHDGIASQLWAIRLNVDNIQQSRPAEEAAKDKKMIAVFQQLTDVTQEVRKTAHNLLPDLLLEEGLATAIASLCSKTSKHTALDVDFQEYGVVPRINKDIELSIYRMVQELIQNVMKHAYGATSLLVQISCVDTLLNITVEDNGIVYSEKNREKEGIGLQQIKKRTEALNGHFDLQITAGKGTTAYLEFDIQHLL